MSKLSRRGWTSRSRGFTTKLERTEARLSEAVHRLDDQEKRSRRKNIKPERTEGANAKEVFETWLPKKPCTSRGKNGRIKTDRCHRSPGQLRTEPTRPKIAYICLHNYANKQMIMQSARNMGENNVSGNRIHFFEDFHPRWIKRGVSFWRQRSSEHWGFPTGCFSLPCCASHMTTRSSCSNLRQRHRGMWKRCRRPTPRYKSCST